MEVVIAAAGEAQPIPSADLAVCPFPVRVLYYPEKSAARQRNQAAASATGDVLAFLDDDIEFGPDLFARVLAHFDRLTEAQLGAASPRIANTDRNAPGRFTRWYYTLQAGYADSDFGGRLFGSGLNCFPLYHEGGPELMPVEWLPSTCLFMRAGLFHRHRFPSFTGYSFAEDVHLTARAAREAPLFFLREPAILHHSLPSAFKADRAALIAGKLHNMGRVARDVMGLRGWALWWRWQLHRGFLTAVLLCRRPPDWGAELRGIWRAQL
jgi:glycosyltransferase involved in cell wall biosynthesis